MGRRDSFLRIEKRNEYGDRLDFIAVKEKAKNKKQKTKTRNMKQKQDGEGGSVHRMVAEAGRKTGRARWVAQVKDKTFVLFCQGWGWQGLAARRTNKMPIIAPGTNAHREPSSRGKEIIKMMRPRYIGWRTRRYGPSSITRWPRSSWMRTVRERKVFTETVHRHHPCPPSPAHWFHPP